jgi:hypothetical protein
MRIIYISCDVLVVKLSLLFYFVGNGIFPEESKTPKDWIQRARRGYVCSVDNRPLQRPEQEFY